MSINTVEELIDWSRNMHGQLATCLAQSSKAHKDERAGALLDYLASHERKLETMVAGFEQHADPRALHTWVYDFLSHKPIKTPYSCDGHYAQLDFEQICREVFDVHHQVMDLYRDLTARVDIPEAKELLRSLLEMEEHEVMRLSQQVGRMGDL